MRISRAKKAIGFDLGDTLLEYTSIPLNWEREYPAALQAICTTLSLELTSDQARGAIEILKRHNTRLNPRVEELSSEHIFKEILLEWKYETLNSLHSVIDSFFTHFRQKLQPFPDAVRMLRHLKSLGIGHGVFTDVPYGMPREYVIEDIESAGLDVPAANLLTSIEAGRRKPDPGGIIQLAGLLGSNMDDFAYVGNEQKDITAAKNAGCTGILIWRSTASIPDWGQDLTLETFDDLTSLLAL